MTGTDDFEQIVVERDGDRDIRFVGKLLASAKSSPNDSSVFYSGSPFGWAELELYETKGGKFVCQRIECGFSRNHLVREYTAAVCKDEQQVFEFLGHDAIAKQLYYYAGFDDVVEVE